MAGNPSQPRRLATLLTRRALRLLSDARLLRVRKAAADISEAPSLDAFGLLPTRGVGREARTCRDEPSDDDVLFEAAQVVLQATHRGFGEHAGCLLERSRRDERLGCERRLGDTEQHRLQSRLSL